MSSKKYILFIGLFCLLTSGLYAQVGTSYDVLDSSLVQKKNLPQHNEFVNNAYPFPAKPRNQWEFGVKAGAFSLSSDVRSRFPGFGAGLSLRKALGYVFSIRGEVGFGTTKGLNFQPTGGSYAKNSAWMSNGYIPGTEQVFYNYKTNVGDVSLQAVATLNNIRFHKAKTGFNAYAFAGVGGMIYHTDVDALKGSAKYNFSTIIAKYAANGFQYKDRNDIRKDLKNEFDGSYETHAEEDPGQPKLFGTAFKPTFSVGAGLQFKLSKRVSLAIEDKVTFSKSDLLDGQQWQNNFAAGAGGAVAQTRDYDSYNFLSVGLNFTLGGRSVEPLWWMNPLDYAYNELNAPKHMKLPKPILDDADGDGVTDQFDLEPNTPAGAPVDAHGVSKDTDGDGVPDYRDKELITPTLWQPVDADGVGKAPDPACCATLDSLMRNGSFRGGCGIGDLPSVSFSGRGVVLNNDAKAVLGSVAQKIRNNPNCKIAVIGYGESSKSAQQLSWDRVNAVINYLVEKEGIGSDRFVFKYGEGGGDPNTVDLRDGTGEEGPNTVPAPHPNLRKKN